MMRARLLSTLGVLGLLLSAPGCFPTEDGDIGPEWDGGETADGGGADGGSTPDGGGGPDGGGTPDGGGPTGPWVALGGDNAAGQSITGGAVHSDGRRLLHHFCYDSPGTNLDQGILREWDGSRWTTLVSNTSNQCHEPDVAVSGDLFTVTGTDDSGDLFYGSNFGNGVSYQSSTKLSNYDARSPTVAYGLGASWASYSMLKTGGTVAAYADCLYDCSGIRDYPGATPNGGVGRDVTAAGTPSALYVAFTTPGATMTNGTGCVEAMRLTGGNPTYLASCFSFGENPTSPQIFLHGGQPMIAWLEAAGAKGYLALWNGSAWDIPAAWDAPAGTTLRELKGVSDGSNAYLLLYLSDRRLWVQTWDGTSWAALEDPPSGGAALSDLDLNLHEGKPVVSFVTGGELRVLKYTR